MRNWCALKLNFHSRQPEPTRLCNNVLNYSREFAEEGSLCAIHARILRPRRNLLSVTSVQGRSKLFEIRGGHSMPTATAVIIPGVVPTTQRDASDAAHIVWSAGDRWC